MRIALFSGNYNFLKDGANQALNILVAHLEANGHRVRVYSPVSDTPAFEPTGTLVPVPSIRPPVRSEFRVATGLPKSVRDDIERFAPDLFHVSAPDILGTRAQTLAKRLGVPVVASMHTRFETYLDHYRLGWLRPLLEAHLDRFYRRADWVLAPTPALVEQIMALRGDSKVSVWSRGIDRDLFSPARRDPEWRQAQGWREEDIVLLFFGRLVVEKGVDVFAAVVRALRENGRRVRPLIVGAGPAESRMRALPDAVLTGHLQGEALARAIASADIMLHPSTTETFGNVVLEGMASGLSIVCGDAPSARALLDPGRTGLICDSLDVGRYAKTIEALIDDPNRRRQIGKAARKASAAYSWDAASRSVEEVYRKVLGGGL